jgi:hypothetical protein
MCQFSMTNLLVVKHKKYKFTSLLKCSKICWFYVVWWMYVVDSHPVR